MSTVFVPVVLTEADSSDPLFAAALEIENALHKAGVLTLERHRREEPST